MMQGFRLAILLGILGPLSSACGTSAGGARSDGFDWLHDYDAALRLAREVEKPVFAYLETEWCTYCRQMEASTLHDAQVVEELGDEYVWLKLDGEEDEQGAALTKRFQLTGFPGMLILDPRGDEIDRLFGYIPPQEFVRQMRRRTRGPESLRQLVGEVEQAPEGALAHFNLALRRYQREEFALAGEGLTRYLELDLDDRQQRSDEALYLLARCEALNGRLAEALKALERLEGRYPESRHAADAVLLLGQVQQRLGRQGQAQRAFQRYLRDYPDHGYADRVQSILNQMGRGLPLASSH